MTQAQKTVAKWILIVSALFAIMELMVSASLCISPESVLETVDLSGKGVIYIVYMWASRQFALGVIFAFATFKRSAPMLTIAYVFFLVMFIGDVIIGSLQNENSLVISAIIMSVISAVTLYFLNRK